MNVVGRHTSAAFGPVDREATVRSGRRRKNTERGPEAGEGGSREMDSKQATLQAFTAAHSSERSHSQKWPNRSESGSRL